MVARLVWEYDIMEFMIKLCKICNQEEEHSVRPNGKPFVWCKKCQRSYSKNHYEANKANHNARRYQNKKGERAQFNLYMEEIKSKPCTDCGSSFPPFVMDFDHVPSRGEKLFNISEGLRLGKQFSLIEKEIAKCDLVCANCHRIRTFGHRDIA